MLRSHLERVGARPWLRLRDQWVSAHALLRDGELLTARLQAGGHRRFMVAARRVDETVCALLAAERLRSDLVIAHPTLDACTQQSLIEQLSITAVIGDGLNPSAVAPSTLEGPSRDTGRVLVMTSGTSGTPKVAEHRLERLTSPIKCTRTSRSSRWLLTYPPSTFAGLQVVFTAIVGEGSLVEPQGRSPSAFLEACLSYDVTHVSGTPTFWRAFLQVLGSSTPPPLRQITIGGEVVDVTTLTRLRTRFPSARISQIYASTEAGVVFTVDDGEPGFPSRWLDEGIGGVQLRVRDGVLEVLSSRRMERYAADSPSIVTKDGWTRTGDLVEVRGDRCLFAGRADRRINVAGYKVSAEEVEAVLIEHEQVAQVRVYGAPSPLTGEVLIADVVLTSTGNEEAARLALMQHARTRLEPYKVPRVINTTSEVGVTVAGKTDRRGSP